jgi:hypothetical protein
MKHSDKSSSPRTRRSSVSSSRRAILGPSGSGKASVARAGLIPELASRLIPGYESPRVVIFTPGAHPLESLATVLARITIRDEMPVAKAREFVEHLDDATVELLINETKGRDGVLPLLQFALTRIWEGMAQGVAPAETPRQIGGVGGALAVEAQKLYDGLNSDTDKGLARRAFTKLVRVGKDIPTVPRTVTMNDLVARGDNVRRVREVLECFASRGARILTLSANAEGTETVKITHDALIEHWTQLGEWIKAAYDDLLFQYRLEDAADYRKDQGRPRDLLWRSANLDRLGAFHERAGYGMTDIQMEFLEASNQAVRRRRILIATISFAAAGRRTMKYRRHAWTSRTRASVISLARRRSYPVTRRNAGGTRPRR